MYLHLVIMESEVRIADMKNKYRDKWVCHHSMARPQVAVGGTASNMKGSCKYIE